MNSRYFVFNILFFFNFGDYNNYKKLCKLTKLWLSDRDRQEFNTT